MTRARIRSWVYLTFFLYPQQAGLALLTSLSSWPCIDQPHLSTEPSFPELRFFAITDQIQDNSGRFQKQDYFSAPGHVFTVSLSFQNERGKHQSIQCCLLLVTWLYFMVWGFGLAFPFEKLPKTKRELGTVGRFPWASLSLPSLVHSGPLPISARSTLGGRPL